MHQTVKTGSPEISSTSGALEREAIARFAAAHDFRISETFSEVETGKSADALDRFRRLFVSWLPPNQSSEIEPSSVSIVIKCHRDVCGEVFRQSLCGIG